MDSSEKRPDIVPGHETRDVKMGRIVGVGIVSLIILVVALLVMNQIFIAFKEKVIENVVLRPVSVPLRELRDHEDDALNSFKVLDTQKGIYRIPIKRAMEILANRAYQSRQESQGNPKAP